MKRIISITPNGIYSHSLDANLNFQDIYGIYTAFKTNKFLSKLNEYSKESEKERL